MGSLINLLKFVLFTLYVSIGYGAKLPFKPVYDSQVQDSFYRSQVPVTHAVPVHHQEHMPDNYNDAVTNRPVAILQQESAVNPDGSFYNVWESENGIKVQEEGTIKVFAKDTVVQTVNGRFSYTDNDGTPFVLTYTADENGFQPQGDHLPTPPPIPHAIVKALEYIAAHPYVEPESDDLYWVIKFTLLELFNLLVEVTNNRNVEVL